MSTTIKWNVPHLDEALHIITLACTTAPAETVAEIAETIFGIDPVFEFDDGSELDQEDLAYMIEGRLLEVFARLGLATFEQEA